jgi:two-component system cell cycle sensor histidine kinase/response regulator CckA
MKALIPESTTLSPASSTPDRPIRDGFSGPVTVLVVDDDISLRTTTVMMLECLGFKTLSAANGLEALQQMEKHPGVGAVLLDVLMPVMDGEETFRQMRSMWAGVPVILISGFALSEMAGRFDEPLPNGYVQKPFTLAKLAGAVRGVLN